MKEFSIEQKAKAYDEALKVANNELRACGTFDCDCARQIFRLFPELKENKESDDEKVRKGLIELVKQSSEILEKKNQEQMIDWLEKQGEHTNKVEPNFKVGDKIQFLRECGTIMTIEKIENGEYIFKDNMGHVSIEEGNKWHLVEEQKPADKVEPKFHQGEWITNGDYTWKIIEVKPLDYILQSQDGNIVDDTISHVDEQFHSFTIEDAKDGDVLACESGWTCIFKKLNHNSFGEILFDSYCFIDRTGWFCDGAKGHTLNERMNGKIHPATKEQRDLLFQKMREASYEWDREKKELKEIEKKSAENEELTEFDKAVGISIGTWNPKTPEQIQSVKAVSKKLLKLAKKQINDEQKVAWSEEDEKMWSSAIEYVQTYPAHRNSVVDWLRTIKDRVQPQPKVKLQPTEISGNKLNLTI